MSNMAARDSNVTSQVSGILAELYNPPTPEKEPGEPPVSEAEETPEPEEPETPEPEEPETEEVPESEEPETEPEGEPEVEPTTFEGRSLRDVAEAFGADVADLYKIKIPVSEGIDPITLGELKDTYQNAQRAAKRQTDLDQAKAEFDTWRAEREQALQAQNHAAIGVLQQVHAKMTEEFQKVNWDELRRDDPAEWSARQNEFQTRNAELQQMYATLVAQDQQQEQQRKQEADRARAEYLAQNRQALFEKAPEWKDPKVAEAESAEITRILTAYGFKPEEFSRLSDHRVVLLLRDLAKLKGATKQAPVKAQALKKLPPMRKPGAARPSKPANSIPSHIMKAAKAGDRNAQVAAVSKILEGL